MTNDLASRNAALSARDNLPTEREPKVIDGETVSRGEQIWREVKIAGLSIAGGAGLAAGIAGVGF